MQTRLLGASIALVLTTPAFAAEPDTRERLQSLEQRLERLEGEKAKTAGPASGRISSNAFNPAVSLILNGRYASFEKDPDSYALPGFALGEETGPGDEGLRLSESELVMSANIDDKFYGSFTAALTPENEVEVEEAYLETLTLGHGFTIKAGRYYSHIGYLNSVHAHAWDFADPPLAYRAMLANQFGDDGVQLRWVAPTDLFLEAGAELFRGESFPAGGAARSGRGAKTGFLRIGGDAGAGHAWRLGISRLKADADERNTGEESAPDIFEGESKLTIVDFVWKWAPDGNPARRHVKFQAEHFRRDEQGRFNPASSGALAYDGRQSGWYAQAVYQFMPRWRLGLRHDRLKADPVGAALAGSVLDAGGHEPRRSSAMIDFSNSEYSRLRLQVNRDESRAEARDTQWYVQYVMSLGAHGAHKF
jgi:hypothetical protein